jgi:D-sorbitol dehydrogenase (acceptor)
VKLQDKVTILTGAARFLAPADADSITARTLNVDGGNWMS